MEGGDVCEAGAGRRMHSRAAQKGQMDVAPRQRASKVSRVSESEERVDARGSE